MLFRSELDLAQHQVTVHDGGYDSFLEEHAIARRHAREAYDQYAATRADLVQRARTQREWSSQGVRNAMRKNPDNDKIRRKAATDSAEKQAQKVRQMESRIARLEEVEEPRKEWVLQFDIAAAPRSSTVVATLNAATLRLGDFVLGPVSAQVEAGDRIGITGPNGAGKTSLLRLLLGQAAPDDGSASLGASVAVGVIDQARTGLDEELPLGEAFEAVVPEWTRADVRTLLAKFGLKADQVTSTVGRLSPGERKSVVAHETAHAAFGHHALPASWLLRQEGRLDPRLALRLMSWSRRAEISCDRVGLVEIGRAHV